MTTMNFIVKNIDILLKIFLGTFMAIGVYNCFKGLIDNSIVYFILAGIFILLLTGKSD